MSGPSSAGLAAAASRRRTSPIVERAALVGVSLLLLAGMELALRAAGYGSAEGGTLDFGASGFQRIYGPDPDAPGWMTLAPWIREMRPVNIRKLVNRSRFPEHREHGELRVFAVGESTVFGYPADGRIAFPARLQEILAARFPGRQVRVVNAGIPTYDSYRVEEVLKEVLGYDPQVVILYSGSNEYFRRFALERLASLGWRVRLRQRLMRLRLAQLLRGAIHALLPQPARRVAAPTHLELEQLSEEQNLERPRGPQETALVMARYRLHLQGALEAAAAARTTVILSTVASRLQEPPIHSTFEDDVERARLAPFLEALAAGSDATAQEALVRTALDVAPGYAPLHHALGRTLEAQGRRVEAFAAYLEARERESSARRAGRQVNAIVHELGARYAVPVVDCERMFQQRDDRGCFGEQLFYDHCHPLPEGHVMIATAMADAIDWSLLPR